MSKRAEQELIIMKLFCDSLTGRCAKDLIGVLGFCSKQKKAKEVQWFDLSNDNGHVTAQ